MKNQSGLIDFTAEVGLTERIGGLSATEQLMELCYISIDSYIKAANLRFVGHWCRRPCNLSFEAIQVTQKGK